MTSRPTIPGGMTLPEASLDAHIAILGTTGGGKSYTARGIVERLLEAGRPVCILDPVGVWWGLRSNYEGDGPGFPVTVLGGVDGDMPLTESMGEPLADIVATQNVPMVIDYSEMGVGERNRFLTAFLSRLYMAKARHKRALWLVLEEVDEIAPQQVRPEGARLLDAVDKIARRGRSRGFRLTSISQRPQVINKNVLTQTTTMIAHRLTAPQDRKAVGDWITAGAGAEFGKEMVAGLPALETGEAWVWAQGAGVLERIHMPMIKTFDSSRTPAADEEFQAPTNLAAVDVSALRSLLESDQDDQTAEPQEIVTRTIDASAEQIAAARSEGYNQGWNDLAQQMRQIIDVAGSGSPPSVKVLPPKKAEKAKPRKTQSAGDGALPQAAKRMLVVLDTSPPVKMSWNALAARVGNKARGGHFNSVRKALLDRGLVKEDGDLVYISEASETAQPALPPDEAARELRDQWKSILGGRSAQIIDVLYELGAATKQVVADHLGCAASGGHWNSAWKSLRDNDVIRADGEWWSLTPELSGGV